MAGQLRIGSQKPSQRSRNRRGVLLLLVMACIVIAGIAMVGITRKSLRMASDSVEVERELQHRWGTVSMQRTLLQGAPKIFGRLEEQARLIGKDGPYTNSVRSSVLLGGINFDALLADENAKLNLNRIYHERGLAETRRAISLVSNASTLPVRLVPEISSAQLSAPRPNAKLATDDDPENEEEAAPPPPPAFRHWGQVFDLAKGPRVPSAPTILPAATARLTCWGRGRVNINRAPDEVAEQVCSLVLGQGVGQRLIREYRENPVLSIKQIAERQEIDESDIAAVLQLLGTRSSDFSLWLSVSSSTATQRRFAVSYSNEEGATRTDRFEY